MFQYFKDAFTTRIFLAVAKNFLLLLALFMATRIVFFLVNATLFPDFKSNDFGLVLQGSLLFDIATIVYVNLMYMVFVLMPLPSKWRINSTYIKIQHWLFVVTNAIALLSNIVDTVYFQYNQRRTTITVFKEFANEHNLSSIFLNSMMVYWYLTVFAVVVIFVLYYGFSSVRKTPTNHRNGFNYWLLSVLMLVVVFGAAIIGVRGGVNPHVHPIAMTNATQYVKRPMEASVVLNTPFSFIRSSSNKKIPEYKYFSTLEQAETIFPTLHVPQTTAPMKKLNVVVIIMESFSKGYIGALNKELVGPNYKGYTPFLDSLINNGLTFENSIANGHRSIDALPSILASVPSVIESYLISDYGNNDIKSIAGELKDKGYYSAFFHGAANGSLGMWAFAKGSGFDAYFGKNEYGNDDDFDGTWAIWDEEFLEFSVKKMNTFQQPFVSAFFSATSHNPFVIPERYKNTFKEESLPIYKCIRYSDNALRTFFKQASKTEWFKNTLFVITGDHTNMIDIPQYQTNMGLKSVPILFYYPAGIKPEVRKEIVEQIDIKPSVLGFLGYDKPYIAFGRDVFHSTSEESYAIYENNYVYEFLTKDYLLQFDGQRATSLYKYNSDKKLITNLLTVEIATRDSMEKRLKAMLQIYQSRMRKNSLVVRD